MYFKVVLTDQNVQFPSRVNRQPMQPISGACCGECCVCCTSAGGGLSSLCSPSVWYQGQWHRTGRTFPHAVWQCQDCFLPLSFITEAPFSLREPLCVSILWSIFSMSDDDHCLAILPISNHVLFSWLAMAISAPNACSFLQLKAVPYTPLKVILTLFSDGSCLGRSWA